MLDSGSHAWVGVDMKNRVDFSDFEEVRFAFVFSLFLDRERFDALSPMCAINLDCLRPVYFLQEHEIERVKGRGSRYLLVLMLGELKFLGFFWPPRVISLLLFLSLHFQDFDAIFVFSPEPLLSLRHAFVLLLLQFVVAFFVWPPHGSLRLLCYRGNQE